MNNLVGKRVVADLGSAGKRVGTILKVYYGEFGCPGATWVKFMPDNPIHYGCSVDIMTSEIIADVHST